MRILAMTQARLGSTRLPNKVLKKIGKETLLDIHLKRLMKSSYIDRVLVATTTEAGSDQICDVALRNGCLFSKGSTEDVLDRFYQAALPYNPEWVIRVTSDCPLLDAKLVDEVIDEAIKSDFDYYTNTLVEDFPDGQDIEIFKMSALTKAWKEAKLPSEREHVTPFIRKNCTFKGGELFRGGDYSAKENYGQIRMTVDEPADFEMMAWLIGELGIERRWKDYVDHMLKNPKNCINQDIVRNEGYLKSLKRDRA